MWKDRTLSRDCPFFRIDDLTGDGPRGDQLPGEVRIVEGCAHPNFVEQRSNGEKLGCDGLKARCVIEGGYPRRS
jgi:hypothetical protein